MTNNLESAIDFAKTQLFMHSHRVGYSFEILGDVSSDGVQCVITDRDGVEFHGSVATSGSAAVLTALTEFCAR